MLNANELSALSRLLDEALELEPVQLEPWLAALPAEHQRLVPHLRDMVAKRALPQPEGFLASGPRLPSADDAVAHAGDRVGAYRLLREIGRGGMGSVWLAERADGAYRRQVALKLPRLAWGAGLAERMAREREIGMLLEHPAIARLYDAGVDERGRPFLALEYVDGQPIDAWCEAQGLSVRDRLRLFVQVVKAVAYAHGRLVVHRDLKPSNVLVSADGQVHLLDFGIAKLLLDAAPGNAGLTQEQGRVMTPHYASPEQVAGEAITVQSDVYSLGVLLYELLTGTLPIAPKRRTLGAVEEAILEGDAPLASSRVKDRNAARALRGEVDAILAKAMQREPGRRYATADALATDIERHLSGETVSARPDSVSYRLRKAVRRHWVGVSAVAAVLVAVLTGSGVAVVQAQRAAKSAERERMVKDFVSDVFRVNSRVNPESANVRPAASILLLEQGAQLIQQRFSREPDLQAELYEVVSGVFFDMGAYQIASDYSTKAIELHALLNSNSMAQSRVWLRLAQSLFAQRRFVEAEVRLHRILEMGAGDDSIQLDTLTLLARTQWSLSRHAELTSSLQSISHLLARSKTHSTSVRAWLLFLQANVLANRARLDQAFPIWQQAIDVAVMDEGKLSLTAVEMRLGVVRSLQFSIQFDLAQKLFNEATHVLKQLGGAHEVRAALAEAQYASDAYNAGAMPPALAKSILQGSRAVLSTTSLPIMDWWVANVDFWIADVELYSGHVSAGLALMEASGPLLQQVADPRMRMLIAEGLSYVLMHAGRHERAEKHFKDLSSLRTEIYLNRDPIEADDIAGQAQNFLMQGDLSRANAVLEAAPQYGRIYGDNRNPERFVQRLVEMKARVKLASGDAAGAIALLKTTVFDPNEEDATDLAHHDEALGEALCANRDYVNGLAKLKSALTRYEKMGDVEIAPWIARDRAVIGACALEIGDRVTAAQSAAQARAAFTAQPDVSSYYKAPLFKLERALGLRLPPV